MFINETLVQGMTEGFEGALQVSSDYESAGWSLYVFNGSIDSSKDGQKDSLNSLGARIWGATTLFGIDNKLTLDFTSHGADSEGVQGVVTSPIAQKIPVGLVAYTAAVSSWILNFEYAKSLRDYASSELSHSGVGAAPEAGQVEISKEFGEENPWVAGLQYQWTDEARSLELPEQRYGVLIGKSIAENQSLKLELHRDRDYSVSSGGTGLNSFGAIVQFEVTF